MMLFRISLLIWLVLGSGCGLEVGSELIAGAFSGAADDTARTRRLLVAGSEFDPYYAALSSDGRLLAHNNWDTGELVVRNLWTGEQKVVFGGYAVEDGDFAELPVFSPDNSTIAFAACCDPGYVIRTVGVDGSNPALLLREPGKLQSGAQEEKWFAHIEPKAWSPDGRSILASLKLPPTADSDNDNLSPSELAKARGNVKTPLALISVEDGSIEVLKPESFGIWKAGYSPDGKFLAFGQRVLDNTQNFEVFTMDLSTRREVRVAAGHFLGWHPSGQAILYGSGHLTLGAGQRLPDTAGIQMLPIRDGAASGPPTRVHQNLSYYQIGLTGGVFYYGLQTESPGLHTLTADLESARVLSPAVAEIPPSHGGSRKGRWSPDGRYLAYISKVPNQGSSLVIHPVEGGIIGEFPLPKGYKASHWVEWLPDSSGVLMSDRLRGTPGPRGAVLRFDLKEGTFSTLLDFQIRARVMSPDTTTMYRLRGPGGDPNKPDYENAGIYVIDVATGEERKLRRVPPPQEGQKGCGIRQQDDSNWSFVPGLRIAAVGPDNKTLALRAHHCIGILRPGAETVDWIYEHPNDDLIVNVEWTPDGKWFVFSTRGPQTYEDKLVSVWRVSSKGGSAAKLFTYPGLGDLQVHPDGRRMSFYGGNTRIELWAMDRLPDVP